MSLRFLLALAVLTPSVGFAQSSPLATPPQAPAGAAELVRRLSVDDAVKLALEQNLGIQIERINPQIQDVAVAQARSFWAPNLSSSFNNNSTSNPPTNALAGGLSKITDSTLSTTIGLTQALPTGANYAFGWNSARASTTNIFSNFDPLLRSNVFLNVSQPLLKDFKIDNVRQQLELSKKARESADVQLRSTIVQTTRNVKNAYWDLAFQVNNLAAQRQSLQLAQRLLKDNERRVQIGTMAPIDIVEAQSEVARNDESVIVAEAAIKSAEDRLRALIYDPATPNFWTISIEPADTAPFRAQTVDVDAAIRNALDKRTDLQQAKNSMAQSDVSIRYFKNQILPDVNAVANYSTSAVGGVSVQTIDSATGRPLTSFPTGPVERLIMSQRGFGSVLGDVVTSAFPTWTVGIQVGYPLGTSTQQTNLARAKLQYSQAQTQLRSLELTIVTQVREAARTVQTNQKRVESARAARELAEKRLDAEEKKFAAGIQTTFFVFQAQRDLAQARTNEVRAISDYNKSQVDLEAVQEVGGGGGGVTSAGSGAIATRDVILRQ
jgi:outer membrane protein TolC